MSEKATNVDKWRDAALALAADEVQAPRVPVAVMLQEAAGVALFVRRRWEADAERKLPGLSLASAFVQAGIAEEIEELGEAARVLQTRVLFPERDALELRQKLERGETVLDELSAALELVLDDGVAEPADAALDLARQRLAADQSQAGMAQALSDFAGVAEQVKARISTLGDFEPALIEEARQLSRTITAAGPPQRGRPASPDLDLRNRMLTLLDRRVDRVRAAARYVYRHHPEVARQVTSAYERRRRAEWRESNATSTSGAASSAESSSTPA